MLVAFSSSCFRSPFLAIGSAISCILLLRNSAAPATSPADPTFHFIQFNTVSRTPSNLIRFHKSLQRDYQILSYLLQHAAGLELDSFEDRILVLDTK